MTCPVCAGKVIVEDSVTDCESVYRRRKCKECNYVFYTTESELKESDRDFHELKSEHYK